MKPQAKKALLFAACAVFYLFFCIRYGVQLRSDSRGYIEMIAAREPVYPLFLAFFRFLFGEAHYLFAVIVVQNLLMAAAVCVFVCYTERILKLSPAVTVLMVLIHFGVEILCQYFSKRAGTYPSTIMTEGVCLALWLIFLRFVMAAVLEDKKEGLIAALILAAVMTDTRKQMAVAYPLLCLSMFFCRIGKDKGKRFVGKLLLTVAGCLISLLLALLGTRVYNYALRGSFSQNTRDMNLVLTTALYAADPEDEALIGEESVRELFVRTMEILSESESNHAYAGKGLRALEQHYEEHFDIITIETTGPLFLEYAKERGFAEGMESEQEADRMSSVIVSSLLADNLGTYLRIYIASVYYGLCNTVVPGGAALAVPGICLYLLYAVLAVLCFKRKELQDTGRYALIVFLAILCNVGVSAALIFCQSRYMIYNMAPFYMAGLAMLAAFLPMLRTDAAATEKKE